MKKTSQSVEILRNRYELMVRFLTECAGSNEPGAVSQSVRTFLRLRLFPETFTVLDAKHSGIRFEKGEYHRFRSGRLTLRIPLPVPEIMELTGIAPENALEKFELESLYQSIAFFNEKYEKIVELRGLTYTDDVTGLYNQRYLETVLERELALAKRNQTPFSVLFLDLDHFKVINDSHGHLIGSRILYEVGEEIRKTLRESDITFRFGGDEFVCVLSHTALPDALNVAERVRVQLEKKRFLAKEGLNIRITTSIGVAAFPDHAMTRDEILNAADEALYGVKDGERNKVVSALAGSRG